MAFYQRTNFEGTPQSEQDRNDLVFVQDQGSNIQNQDMNNYNQQQTIQGFYSTNAGMNRNGGIQYNSQINNDQLIEDHNEGVYDRNQQNSNKYQSQIDVIWSRSLQGGVKSVNNNIQGFISKENPKKHLVYANNVLKIIDVSQSQGNNIQLEVSYKEKDLVYSSFKGDYLITNYIVTKTQQSFLEIKRLQSKDHNQRLFSQDNQLSIHQQQQSQLSAFDYVSCEMFQNTTVTKAHLYQHYGQIGQRLIDQQQQQNKDELREILIILRRRSNVIEIREIKHSDNKIIILNVIEFDQFQENALLQIEDFKIVEDRMIVNFENQYIYVFGVLDLLNQTGNVFNNAECQKLERFNLANAQDFKIASIDHFFFQQQSVLIITKESQNPEIAHQLELYNFQYIELIKMLSLIPTFNSDIEHTQEYQELLNLDQGNNNNYLNRGGNMIMSAFSAQHLYLKGQTRKILDTLSTDFTFLILAKEGRSIIMYMIDRYSQELSIQQVNQGQLLKGDNNRLIDELQGARIIPESLYQTLEGIQVDIIMLSNQGGQISQLRINQPNSKLVQECSQYDKKQFSSIPRSTIQQQLLNGINTNMYDQNDPLLIMQSQVQTSLETVEKLLSFKQFKKLAEYVLMKVDDRDEDYIFEGIGALEKIMQSKIDQIMVNEIPIIFRLEDDISEQIMRLEGYHTVFSAIIKREHNIMKLNEMIAKETLQEKLDKQTNFMKLLLFMVQSEFLPTLYQLKVECHPQLSKISKDMQQEGTCLQALFKQQAPDLLRQYPISELEQYISIFDQSVLPEKPLTIIYYHILEFQQLKLANGYQYPDLKPFFQQSLSHLLSTQSQTEIEALWTLDHLELQHLFANQQQISSEIIAHLLRGRKFEQFDHLVIHKLISVGQSKYALEFILQGGCSLSYQLNDTTTLNEIMQLFLNQGRYQQLLTYLKQNETIINNDLYQQQIQTILRILITNNQISQGLFNQSLSGKQREIIEEYLKQQHPDLFFSFNIFSRNQIQGLAKELIPSQINIQQPGSGLNLSALKPSRANDLKQLLHVNYLAALSDDKRFAVFSANNQPLDQIEDIISEKKDKYTQNVIPNSFFNRSLQSTNNTGRVVLMPNIYPPNYQQINKLTELRSKFMADPFFTPAKSNLHINSQYSKVQAQNKNGLMDFFKHGQQNINTNIGQEESKAMFNNEQSKNIQVKSQKIIRGLGLLGSLDQPFIYQEDPSQKHTIGILPTQIKDYDVQQHEFIRQSLSPDRSQHLRSSIARSSRSRLISPNRNNPINQDVFIPTDPELLTHTLGTHDDLLRDTTDLEHELMNKNSLLMQNDYDDDEIAVVPGLSGQVGNRMTARFGPGQQDQDISNVSRGDQRSAILGKNLSTIQESVGESYLSGGGHGEYNASYMSNMMKSQSIGAKIPQRYSMDHRSSSQAASGNNPFGSSSAGPRVDVNMRSGGSGVADSQSLNLQKSELLYDDNDQHVGNLGFQDDEDLRDSQQNEYGDEQYEDDEDDANYPNESPEQRRIRKQKNLMLRMQAQDVQHQKGYKTVVLADRMLTRSEAKRINFQPDEHIELTPAHKK